MESLISCINISEDPLGDQYVDLLLDTDIREAVDEATGQGIETDRMIVLLIQLIRDVRRLATPKAE